MILGLWRGILACAMPQRNMRSPLTGEVKGDLMNRRVRVILCAAVLFAATAFTGLHNAAAAAVLPRGQTALTGADAAAFRLPSDVSPVCTATYPDGTVQSRYHQKVGDASVLGGQLTVIRKGGTTTAVIGAYYPGLVAKNSRVLNA